MKTTGEGSGRRPPEERDGGSGASDVRAWAEAGPGAPCCEAQADGFPCPELIPDCTGCAVEMLLREEWSPRVGPWLPRDEPL